MAAGGEDDLAVPKVLAESLEVTGGHLPGDGDVAGGIVIILPFFNKHLFFFSVRLA